MPIARPYLVTLAMVIVTSTSALAQVPRSDVAPGHADPYRRDPYITSSGATVPNPGKSQSGRTTPQERAIQQENNRIDGSICRGC